MKVQWKSDRHQRGSRRTGKIKDKRLLIKRMQLCRVYPKAIEADLYAKTKTKVEWLEGCCLDLSSR